MVKSLDEIMVHEPYDIKQLVISGFKTSFEKTEELKMQNKQLLEKLDSITEELNHLKASREAKEERRRKRLMAIKQPEREGFLLEHYEAIMDQTSPKKNYVTRRLRVLISIMFVTGLRFSEALSITVKQVHSLFKKQRPYIEVDRLKGGPKSKKAFLSAKGALIVKERQEDFEYLLLSKPSMDDYVFSAENTPSKALSREHFSRETNKILAKIGPNFDKRLRSHSFRIQYLKDLWKTTGDILLVSKIIGHTKIESTLSYIKNVSDTEIIQRLETHGYFDSTDLDEKKKTVYLIKQIMQQENLSIDDVIEKDN